MDSLFKEVKNGKTYYVLEMGKKKNIDIDENKFRELIASDLSRESILQELKISPHYFMKYCEKIYETNIRNKAREKELEIRNSQN
jgi:AraC-like DNA-binding protein